jgi:glucose-1-phosphate thymidylyltransferase
MKGILLAGGNGTRLLPITSAVSKHLLPVYDKPLIYYSLSVLMLAKISDVLIICKTSDIESFRILFGDGSRLGMKISYEIQDKPSGIAEAFIIGEKFIDSDSVALVLGDNIFYGQGFSPLLLNAAQQAEGATIFGYPVKDPQRFGIAEIDSDSNVISLAEKPKEPKSNIAVTGLYFYDNQVIDIAKNLKPSGRGELEITDINIEYLKKKQLKLTMLGRGFAWLDAGTNKSLIESSQFVQTIESRQGIKIACLEEISLANEWIGLEELKKYYPRVENSDYGDYIKQLIEQRE